MVLTGNFWYHLTMDEEQVLIDSLNKKFEKIHKLLNEVIDNHNRMQEMLSEAIITSQTERGVQAIERFLHPESR